MGLLSAFRIAASGMTAERVRMDIISGNLANASVTRTDKGEPFRRQIVLLAPGLEQNREGGKGVRVLGVTEDLSPFNRVYDPGHPDADDEGYVAMPNVSVVNEMVNMISATRAYEANATVFSAAKAMVSKAIEILKG